MKSFISALLALFSIIAYSIYIDKIKHCKEYVYEEHVRIIDGFYKGRTGSIYKSHDYGIEGCWSCSRDYTIISDGMGIRVNASQIVPSGE